MPHQKLLIIDDSPDVHDLVGVWLIEEPIELFHANDGATGVATAQAVHPDLILLDVDMPAADGFAVIAELKSLHDTCDIPVVFLTGASTTDQKLRGLDLGAVDYILKPFDPAELRARVRATLRSKQLLDLLEQKALNLQESEERFRVLAENSSDMIIRHSATGKYLYVSPACRPLLDYTPEQMLGRMWIDFVHPEDLDAIRAAWAARISGGGDLAPLAACTFRMRHRDGRYVWCETVLRPVHDAAGKLFEVHGSVRDITARRRAELVEQGRTEVLEHIAQNRGLTNVTTQLLEWVERLYPGAIASSVVLFDGQLHHTAPRMPAAMRTALEPHLYSFTTRFCSELASLTSPILVSDLLNDAVWADVRDAAAAHGLKSCWTSLIRQGPDEVLGILNLFHADPPVEPSVDGHTGTIARSLFGSANKLIAVAVEHHQMTEQMAYRAQHDALTGLPNRVLYEHRLQKVLAGAAGEPVAVAFLDVDRFKVINDTLGHHAGDVMLCRLAERVSDFLGAEDTLARMGGDEFAMILPALTTTAELTRFGEALVDAFKRPVDVLGQELFVTISVGFAMSPQDGTDSAMLKKNADAALYAAKNGGRDRVSVFSAHMTNGSREKLALETGLRRAILQDELRLHYQPKVDNTFRIVGMEALARWQHPSWGLVPPGKFIPMAEETGLILPIGRWALNEAARQLRSWIDAGIPPVPMAVNVSAVQFAAADFVSTVVDCLDRHRIPARLLELELTESLLMHSVQEAKDKIQELKRIGVTLAIDDFGTGFSSLAYLQQLPLDVLKIDRTFVAGINPPGPIAPTKSRSDESNAAVVRAIAAMAASIGLQLVAEGVETMDQLEFLLRLNAPIFQGFLFSPPVSPEAAEGLLRTGTLQPRPAAAMARSA